MEFELSVIIPTLNEEKNIGSLIDFIDQENVKTEVIISDADSTDNTRKIAAAKGAEVVNSKKASRGLQLNRGAEIASAPILLFLHADSTLERGSLFALVKTMQNQEKKIGGCFTLEIKSKHPLLKFISWSSNLRAKYLHLIFGDQGIFIKKDYFQRLGRFPEIELMEDWEFSKKMTKAGPLIFLNKKIYTSARRWEEGGVLRTILLMHKIKLLYKLGYSPQKLKKIYRDAR
ncbi:MAG: family 2 glycosyl transferase [Halanaerobium sp. 4-GBenrich]|jgi:rSAM/selenodomain-associated transferase 2|uniref:4,4'-diaponeurosporenoate glycosyltransferase n=2 Tax=Halanaerobium congolense TaxID=54121 RepID=A0A1M7P493_9FIRM|nr:TIGR04283 family arsenosugar biosynthesis glycosyltransferase [Halanaerobium congolense]ODS49920.1 MAG: family 2 glycosyl transferase [Halanaerobium sp. 4-GBenrich]PXV68644.1 rSAM/selenodomain-associated transferase 2 [Halanaerobium congolense]TDP18340.1 rSAM/selenodomain-associated transferase 2 [Halanaerobium congolense]TDX39389.1 rSAM/selenodomain-associated transferase 2 [Halanaerobium congolense]SDH63987.1 transferase 2, rSAM/selenodomain-associated [Halanaerobium congolense]